MNIIEKIFGVAYAPVSQELYNKIVKNFIRNIVKIGDK